MTASTPSTHAWGTQPEMFGPRHEHRLGMIVREVERLPRGARFLDGAVGLGQLAVRMQQRGYRVVGIDYSFDAALHVRRNTSIPVVIGDMTRMPFRHGAFDGIDRKSTRLNSSHGYISYAVFCLKKKKKKTHYNKI